MSLTSFIVDILTQRSLEGGNSLRKEIILFFFHFRNKGKSIRKKIRQSIRRKSTKRRKNDDNASSLAAAAMAAAEKAEAQVEAIEIKVLESQTRNRSQLRSGSSCSRKSKASCVTFSVEGDLENLNISEDEKVHQKRKTSSSLNVFPSHQDQNSLELG